MARINNQYKSPYEATIARYLPFIDRWLYPVEAQASKNDWLQNRHFSTRNIDLEAVEQKDTLLSNVSSWLWKYNRFWLKNIAGGFTPVAYMWKDLKDTFKPYKADYQRNRDWLQPINGIGNIIRGVLSLPLAVIATLESVIRFTWWTLKNIGYIFYNPKAHEEHDEHEEQAPFLPNLFLGSTWIVSQLIAHVFDSAFSIIRGVTQIATFPLTWLVKIPLRHFGLTPKDEQTGERIQQKVEDNAGIKKIAQLLDASEQDTTLNKDYAEQMYGFKILKALHKGQPSDRFSVDGDNVVHDSETGEEYCQPPMYSHL